LGGGGAYNLIFIFEDYWNQCFKKQQPVTMGSFHSFPHLFYYQDLNLKLCLTQKVSLVSEMLSHITKQRLQKKFKVICYYSSN
jgi:hypothetical protein